MVKISVVISAFNEEKNITECMESVKWADEIIVVDNSSLDKTAEIAKKLGASVIKKENNLMLNKNKNFGFTKARNEWILNLDADERASVELHEEIKEKLAESKVDGYWIPRKNIIFGKWIQHSIWWPDMHLRLFKKGKGVFPEKHVHEHIQVKGEVEELSGSIIHENYQSISQFLYKMDKIYTENEVQNYMNNGKKVGYLDAVRYPAQDFLKTFFYQKGYKDGTHGLVLSILQSFYAFIIFAKIWEKQGFNEEDSVNKLSMLYKESKKIAAEFNYWFLTEIIAEVKNPAKKIYYKILRKNSARQL